jgi:glycosyltransferase involved in cell wall biosynthesis
MAALEIDPTTVTLAAVAPEAMPRHLALAEAGICFVRPLFSKLASSPTKVGEYLASGLPIVGTAGVGDLDTLLDGQRVGVLLRGESGSELAAAASGLSQVLDNETIHARCRSVAESELSLERGVAAYAEVYARLKLSRSRSPRNG